jgi:hypothetical protein
MPRLFAVVLPPCPFHLFSPLTVTFPKLAVILRPLYHCGAGRGQVIFRLNIKTVLAVVILWRGQASTLGGLVSVRVGQDTWVTQRGNFCPMPQAACFLSPFPMTSGHTCGAKTEGSFTWYAFYIHSMRATSHMILSS